ncbi:SdpI family protein [Lactobacillus sp. ESL0679]|uniref:SdpI family protein n=1 Tax=Lactobacillus sp. ESL0679 TaxID=2983209 RepID=UPI0023F9C2FC|nr:SdpI family protein [Lactobacillus sp. ESL0679]MDF7682807.1 SdpI family protein [Lactobacillus sp. ESL0679]
MMKNNLRRTWLITSLVILVSLLIGLLLWPKLPNVMATHFGNNNEPNGWMPKWVVVFGLPLIMLGLQWFVYFRTAKQDINSKLANIGLWLVPLISVVACLCMYIFNLGYHVKVGMIVTLLVGFVFVLIGNFLPKAQPNKAMGVRLPRTLANSENWRKTNRFTGWLLVLCGLVLMALSCYQIWWLIIPVAALVVILPVIYSYLLAK